MCSRSARSDATPSCNRPKEKLMMTRRHVIAATGGLVAATSRSRRADGTGEQRVSEQWRSNEAVRSRPAKDRRSISPARSASIRCSRRADPARVDRRPRHLRAGRPHRVAHAPARPDADHHVRPRLGAARGRTDRGGPARRRGLVSARPEALAWGDAHDGDDAHRHSRNRSNGKTVDWLEKVSDEQYRK